MNKKTAFFEYLLIYTHLYTSILVYSCILIYNQLDHLFHLIAVECKTRLWHDNQDRQCKNILLFFDSNANVYIHMYTYTLSMSIITSVKLLAPNGE